MNTLCGTAINTKRLNNVYNKIKGGDIILNSAWVKELCIFKDGSLYKKKDDYGRMTDMHSSTP